MKYVSCIAHLGLIAVLGLSGQAVASNSLKASFVQSPDYLSTLHHTYPLVSLAPDAIQASLQDFKSVCNEKQRKANLRRFYMKLFAVVSTK